MSVLDCLKNLFRKKAAFNPNGPVSHVFVDVDAHVPLIQLVGMAPGLQAQLREDFAPEWNLAAAGDIVRVGGVSPQPGEIEIQLHKDAPADEAGALAIHDKKPDGTPIVHVYCSLAAEAGVSLSSCVSHELLEARADWDLTRVVTLPDGRVAALEICDQVEQLSCMKKGAEVSDFNTRANYGLPPLPGAALSAKFDFLEKQAKLFQVLDGGYAQVQTPNGWTQLGPDTREAPLKSRTSTTGHEKYRAELDRLGLSRGSRRSQK